MKRFVNGEEVELTPSPDVQVMELNDRLVVKTPEGAYSAVAVRVGDAIHVSYRGRVFIVEKKSGRIAAAGPLSSGEIRAPMPGLIVDVVAEEGQNMEKGDRILVLEAMKTQQAFSAPFDGVLTKLAAEKGRQVSEGELLAVVSAAEPS